MRRAPGGGLTEPVIAVLAGARSTARVTVVGRPDQVTLSVVAEVTDTAQESAPTGRRAVDGADSGSVELSRLVSGDRLWLDVTWTAA